MEIKNTVSTTPAHLSLEFRLREDAPEGAITFEILGGNTDPKAVFEIYAHPTSHPFRFPLLSQADIFQRFNEGHNAKVVIGGLDSDNFDRFRSESHFKESRFYTMIAIQRNVSNVIIGYSDLRTFFMRSDRSGIRGFAWKYMPNWPNPNRTIVASRSGNMSTSRAKDAWFVDTDGDAYFTTSDGERGARVPDDDPRRADKIFTRGFDELAPEYLMFANKQGITLPDGQNGVGRYVNRFFVVENDTTDNNGNVVATGRDVAFMAGDRKPNNISGIITTKVNINSLL